MLSIIFYQFGRWIYTLRWLIILFWLLLVCVSVPIAPKLMHPFTSIGFKDPHSESVLVTNEISDKIGYNHNRFIVVYRDDKLKATSAIFQKEIKASLSGLKHFPLAHEIIYPDKDNNQISSDNHVAYAVVLLKSSQELDDATLDQFKKLIKKPADLTLQIGGEPVFLTDTKVQTQRDMYKSEYIATPVALITMLIVFGTVVAAVLPIVLGGVCAYLMLVTLFLIGHVISLSVFTLNIALLLGMCLILDYSLLYINRFCEELEQGHDTLEAIAIAQTTAGKAIFFSGLVVFVSLSALVLFPINVLYSVGIGGSAAVFVAVLVAIILLPAVLATLGHRINWLPVRIFKKKDIEDQQYWEWLISRVVKRPVIYFVTILIALLCLGYPFLHAKFGISDFKILPKTSESHQVFDAVSDKFGESKFSPIEVLIQSKNKNILTKNNIAAMYDFASKIMADARVDRVTSIVTTQPRMTKQQYQLLYTTQREHLPDALKKFLKITTADGVSVMSIESKYDIKSPETAALIDKIRQIPLGNNLTIKLSGSSLDTDDVLKTISTVFPKAFWWIAGFTYLLLLIFLRSLFLPLKAILMTILSLVVSYGVLVFVFQQGYFHTLFNFEPQGMLDISLLIIIFCTLFGVSMDYEVFLLTRIKEYYEQTGNNVKSIVFGINRSGRIIASAAIIVILICFSFMSADILIVKAFGLGIAVAVFIDAFVIRTILVPAIMTIMNKWNWYLPKWLDYILPEVTFDPMHVRLPGDVK